MQAWKEFLHNLGGTAKLNFGWSRQSGKKWTQSLTLTNRQRNTLRMLMHGGVPNEYRAEVWYRLSGGSELKARAANSYQQLYQSQLDSRICSEIDQVGSALLVGWQDVKRTFPTHSLFAKRIVGEGETREEEAPYVASLRRILLASSVVCEDFTYCQGMNLLAALLLVVILDEETTFWTFVGLLQYSFPSHYFDETLSGARIDAVWLVWLDEMQELFSEFAREDFPELISRLESFDEHILSISLSWFMHWFIHTLPMMTVVRIWDVIFIEGDKALMRLALALVAINNDNLVSVEDDSDLAVMFRQIRRTEMRHRQIGMLQFNADELIKTAYPPKGLIFSGRRLLKVNHSALNDLRQKKREKYCKRGKDIESDDE